MNTTEQRARGLTAPTVSPGPAVAFGLTKPRTLLEQLQSYLDASEPRHAPAPMKVQCQCGWTLVTVEPTDSAASLLAKVREYRAKRLPRCPHTDAADRP